MNSTHAFLLSALVAAACLSPDLRLGEAMPNEENEGGERGITGNAPMTSSAAGGQQGGSTGGRGGSPTVPVDPSAGMAMDDAGGAGAGGRVEQGGEPNAMAGASM